MSTILKFTDVAARYGNVLILKGLSFEVQAGEALGVIGPNGSGKTTMLNALIGQIIPSGGRISFCGKDITKWASNRRCRSGIGRTYQIPRPFSDMSVFENILVAAVHGAGMSEKAGRFICDQALELTDLSSKRSVRAGELTLLDRKRLEIARALGVKPSLLLLDEVAAGLTEIEAQYIINLVTNLKLSGQTILWIEHIISVLMRSADRLMCMADGRCLLCGSPEEVMSSKPVEEIYLGAEEEEPGL